MQDNIYIINENLPPIIALETGNVVYLPQTTFQLHTNEQQLLCTDILDAKHKNVSYNILNNKLSGVAISNDPNLHAITLNFMQRYAYFTQDLIHTTFPEYKDHLIWGRTSYRPAEIKGRTSSKRQDDTRLHVDAFPSSPVHGKRILRVFCNINPNLQPRIWNIGEPFTTVVKKFKPTIKPYSKFKANFLNLLKITKQFRTIYDHQMLQLHDNMKLDDNYQATCEKHTIEFPAQSTWIVFTDHVSHAALSGQYLLEQTFYLPTQAMHNSKLSPLEQLNHV